MPWFKVDDNLAFHSKTVQAGNAALGLWVRCGSWSAQTLTEGFVPDHMVTAFGGGKLAPSLVASGLWDRVDGGYRFHDWDKYQPSKETVEAEREAARDRQRRARKRAQEARNRPRDQGNEPRDTPDDTDERHGVTDSVTNDVTTPAVTVPPTHPDPTHPDPPKEVPQEPTAATLVAEWIDHCGTKPPSRVVGQVAKELGAMLTEGIPYDDVRRGLASWQGKGLHPSTLASEVHACRTPRAPRADASSQRKSAIFAAALERGAQQGEVERENVYRLELGR